MFKVRMLVFVMLCALLLCGCETPQEYFDSPKDAYLAKYGKEYTVDGELDKLIELDASTFLWVSTVHSNASGACLLTAVCEKQNGKYRLCDTFASDVSYTKLDAAASLTFSSDGWEHTGTDTHEHMWQWTATANSGKVTWGGAVAYDYSFRYSDTDFLMTLFVYSVEKS